MDLRYAFRSLKKSPGFSLVTVLIVALGTGVGTAVFSVVNGALMSPLPFEEADRLTVIWSKNLENGSTVSVSWSDFLDWQNGADSFEALAAHGRENLLFSGREGAERLPGELVSEEYFSVLGVTPHLGRAFAPGEDAVGANPTVVLGYGLWQRLGGTGELIGRTMRLNGCPFTVIGVMPRGFRGFGGEADLWVPTGAFDLIHPELVRYDILSYRGTRWLGALGRLKRDTTLEQARAELDATAARLAEIHPGTNGDIGVDIIAAHEEVVGEFRTALVVLMSAVGFLLMVLTANLAGLFLTRVGRRSREVALRIALGARRGRLMRLILTETMLYSILGCASGLLLAHASLDLLLALAPVDLPSSLHISVDGRVFAFIGIVSIAVGVIIGIVPAFSGLDRRPGESLKAGASSGEAPGQRRAAAFIMTAEVSLAMLLLVGCGLMLNSLYQMREFNPGFDGPRLLTARFEIPGAGDAEAARGDLHLVLDRLESIPGVESVVQASHIFFGGGYMTGDLTVEGYQPPRSDERIMTYRQFVGPGYFTAMGIGLLDGREFDSTDHSESPRVVIVNASFARRFWPGQDPLGKRLMLGQRAPDKPWLTVVGIAQDTHPRFRSAGTNPWQIYLPTAQGGEWSRCLIFRTAGDPSALAGTIRGRLREIDPGMALYSVAAMSELLSDGRSETRFMALLLSVFAGLAALLAALGIFGVVSDNVNRRQREIGLRMAIGARARDILALILGKALVAVLAGMALGTAASLALTRFISSLLFEVSPVDGPTFLIIASVLTAVALVASILPARRAANLDPITVLREE